MRKLLSIVVLLAFLALPAFAQLALFPTPAKAKDRLQSARLPRSAGMADMPMNWLKNYSLN